MNPPGGWGAYTATELGLEPYAILITVLSAVIVYFVFVVVIRVFGAQVLTVTTGTDAVVVIMLGAVAGRAILGTTPTVASGIAALLTLVLMEFLFRSVLRRRGVRHFLKTKPVLVFVDGEPIADACERTRTSADDLNAAMRSAGVANPSEVQCIILEPRGSFSVIRTGTELQPNLFADVEGSQRLRAEFK